MIGKPIFFAIAATSASVSSVPGEPGTTGTPAADINLRASTLSPIRSIASAGGPIQVKPGALHRARKRGAFGEKAVTRMNRVGLGAFGRFKNFRGVKIALGRRRRTDRARMIGFAHVQRGAIGVRVNGHRFDSQLAACADDPHRDLSAVGD